MEKSKKEVLDDIVVPVPGEIEKVEENSEPVEGENIPENTEIEENVFEPVEGEEDFIEVEGDTEEVFEEVEGDVE